MRARAEAGTSKTWPKTWLNLTRSVAMPRALRSAPFDAREDGRGLAAQSAHLVHGGIHAVAKDPALSGVKGRFGDDPPRDRLAQRERHPFGRRVAAGREDRRPRRAQSGTEAASAHEAVPERRQVARRCRRRPRGARGDAGDRESPGTPRRGSRGAPRPPEALRRRPDALRCRRAVRAASRRAAGASAHRRTCPCDPGARTACPSSRRHAPTETARGVLPSRCRRRARRRATRTAASARGRSRRAASSARTRAAPLPRRRPRPPRSGRTARASPCGNAVSGGPRPRRPAATLPSSVVRDGASAPDAARDDARASATVRSDGKTTSSRGIRRSSHSVRDARSDSFTTTKSPVERSSVRTRPRRRRSR